MIIPQPIPTTYSDAKLRILVEEYIAQRRSTFTLNGFCSYVLNWAMEDGHTSGAGLYESNQLAQKDGDRIKGVLNKIISIADEVNMLFQKIS